MLSKIYRYRCDPDRKAEFLALQRAADAIYQAHLDYEVMLYQMQDDAWQWVEIHHFASEADMQTAEVLGDQVPELKELFAQFLKLIQEGKVSANTCSRYLPQSI